MREDDEIAIVFKESELIEIVADYFGFSKKHIDLDDFSEDYIKEIILDRIM